MSKHKSEVLTVKIQLKVKFPQTTITKIRTLPTVIPKIFQNSCRIAGLGTATSDIMYVKLLTCVVGK